MPRYVEGIKRFTRIADLLDPISGDAVGTLNTTGTATGIVQNPVLGVGSGTIGVTGASTGSVLVKGSGISQLSITGSATAMMPIRLPAAMADFYPMTLAVAGMTRPMIDVRRSSDNTVQSFTFGNNGILDTSAILAFCGAGSGFVSKAYHLTNSAKDWVQATNSLQPRICNNGVIDVDAFGLPIIRNVTTGTNGERLGVSNIFASTQSYTFFAVTCPLMTMADANANGANAGVLTFGTIAGDQCFNLMLGVNSSSSVVNNYYVSTELDTGVSATNERARWTDQPVQPLTPMILAATVQPTSHSLRVNMTDATDATENALHNPTLIPASAELRSHMVNNGTSYTAPGTSGLYCAGISAPLSAADRAQLENEVYRFLSLATGAQFQ